MPGKIVIGEVLILGGTAEARALAEALVRRGVPVITSLAGRTTPPRPPPGRLRIGGFGGVTGLRAWLRSHRPAAVIDATHPFAATISAHATEACDAEAVPRLALVRPAWPADPAWHRVASMAEAAALIPTLGRHALLTVGGGDLGAFVPPSAGLHLLARVVTPPEPPPCGMEVIVARGPFSLAGEEALMRRHGIDVLVTKASGGAATAPKLAVARALGVAVVVVDRPPPPPPPHVATVDAAVTWVEGLGGGPGAEARLDSRRPSGA